MFSRDWKRIQSGEEGRCFILKWFDSSWNLWWVQPTLASDWLDYKAWWGLVRVYFIKTKTTKTLTKTKETAYVRQQLHLKQCITMPWHQGHNAISCMKITHYDAWLRSCNRYSHTQSKYFDINNPKTTSYKQYWLHPHVPATTSGHT